MKKRFGGLLVLCASVVFSSCGAPRTQHGVLAFAAPAAHASAHALRAKSAIVVALDGVRWQEIFRGIDPLLAAPNERAHGSAEEIMPTLHRWMTLEGAAIGAPDHGEVWATGPNYVSMPGYTEILTGRTSACQSNDCSQSLVPSIVDQVNALGRDALVISSWERIALVATNAPSTISMSAGRHGVGKTNGIDEGALHEGDVRNPWPGVDDYRPDFATARVALGVLDKRAPTFAFIGLGDPDEHAHHGDYPRYLDSLRAADHFLAELEKRISSDTVVFVTADHGRGGAFRDHGGGWRESGRVWLVARGSGISARGMVDTSSYRLADIAPTIRCLMDLPRDDGREAGVAIRELCVE